MERLLTSSHLSARRGTTTQGRSTDSACFSIPSRLIASRIALIPSCSTLLQSTGFVRHALGPYAAR